MAPIERLLQELRRDNLLTGKQHGAAMKLVVGLLVTARELNLHEDLAEFGGRQAGADDGAMKVVADLPNATPSLFLGIQRSEVARGRVARRLSSWLGQRHAHSRQLCMHGYVIFT